HAGAGHDDASEQVAAHKKLLGGGAACAGGGAGAETIMATMVEISGDGGRNQWRL
ncbi:hypothetical protein U1Q18_033083, partial [Sarracenia purpurea var. burkii]